MASFDPFEQEFGARARSLRRTPSARSWGALERRLDNRRRGTRILGIRPWMVAALVLLAAGVSVISKVNEQRHNPLAKRAAFIEELHAPYVPTEAERPTGWYEGHAPASDSERDPELREVPVAEKYRVHG